MNPNYQESNFICFFLRKSNFICSFIFNSHIDDFVPATAPLSKKSRTTQKELKLEKPEPKLKNLQEKDIPLQEKTPKKR